MGEGGGASRRVRSLTFEAPERRRVAPPTLAYRLGGPVWPRAGPCLIYVYLSRAGAGRGWPFPPFYVRS